MAGTSRRKIIAKIKSNENETRKTADVLIEPLILPFKNKIMGNKKRKSGPIKGTKTAAKTKIKITGRSFEKELADVVGLNFFKKDKLLKI
jgi:hypothetical protein